MDEPPSYQVPKGIAGRNPNVLKFEPCCWRVFASLLTTFGSKRDIKLSPSSSSRESDVSYPAGRIPSTRDLRFARAGRSAARKSHSRSPRRENFKEPRACGEML